MFGFLLSASVLFIFLGVVRNIIKTVYKDEDYDSEVLEFFIEDENSMFCWFVIAICSFVWFVTVPLIVIFAILFALKVLTDWLAKVIIKVFSKGDKNV